MKKNEQNTENRNVFFLKINSFTENYNFTHFIKIFFQHLEKNGNITFVKNPTILLLIYYAIF